MDTESTSDSDSIPEPSDGIAVRVQAARAVFEVVSRGASLDAVVDRVGASLSEKDRALFREISFGSIRWFWRSKGIVDLLVTRALKKRDSIVEAAIIAGLYQMDHMRLPAHAVIHSTVEACVSLNKAGFKGLVNGVLRNFQRRRDELIAALPAPARDAHPDWLIKKIAEDWPTDARSIIDANNARPPMTLRVNTRLVSVPDFVATLRDQGIEVETSNQVPAAVFLSRPRRIESIPGFQQGWFSVQDASAQLLTRLVSPEPGHRVLDACAAPGGKLTHLLETFPGITIQAVERDARRAERIADNLMRLGLEAQTCVADAAELEQWWDGRPFDLVVLDVPCSGTGVIRRHPDIKVLRRLSDIAEFAKTQKRLLDRLWEVLLPGGSLAYVTCSILREENQHQVTEFLARTEGARKIPFTLPLGRALETGWQILPSPVGPDGFYYALLMKD